MNQFKKFAISLLSIILIVSVVTISVNAATNYPSFQEHNGEVDTTMVKQRALFNPEFTLSGVDIGIGDFNSPKDFCVKDKEIYILDSGNSRIVVLNTDYTLNRIIDNIVSGKETVDLSQASGLYADDKGYLYIADPENQKVMIANDSGKVIKEITKPSSPIVPKSLEFKAKKVLTDIDGFIFVLCEGVYYGAMVFDADYNFCGFFGANQTGASLIDSIKYFFTKLFMTDAKKQYSQRKLPYEFDDFYEHNGFIYTATKVSKTGKGQIRKLCSTGVNSLIKNNKSADDEAFGTGETLILIDKSSATEEFGSLCVDEKGYIYALDNTYGHIFVYDSGCNLITAFGGGLKLSSQLGAFKSASEIGLNGSDIIVTDDATNRLTVFKRTEMGNIVYNAIDADTEGEYEKSFLLWQNVLQRDSFNQRAYNGLANYYLSIEDNQKAMEYAKKAMNKDIYDQSFEVIRRNFLEKHFVWFFVILFVIIGIFIFVGIKRKKNRRSVLDLPVEKSIPMRIISSWLHPIETAYYIKRIRTEKQKKELNIFFASAIGIVFLFFIFRVLETTAGGFLYVNFDANKYNSGLVFISTVGIVTLWCIVNWGLCTLFQGKGTFKEIVITTSFALIPQIIYSIFFIVASNCLVYSESAIITGLSAIASLTSVIVLLVELSVIHDYSFFRAIGMSLATVIGIGLAAFIILLTLTLFRDASSFFVSIINDVFYRT